jgi:predicted ATPase
MKLTKIKLNDYLIFKKDTEINLRYPTGHLNSDKPLNKVCFLGQSGTGKSTLLNLIKYISFERHINADCLEQNFLKSNSVEISYYLNNVDFSKISLGNSSFKYINQHESDQTDFKLYIESLLAKDKVCLMNFPYDVIRDVNFDTPLNTKEYADLILRIKPTGIKGEILGELEKNSAVANKLWDFGSINIKTLWEHVFENVKSYREQIIKKKLEIFDKIEKKADFDKAKQHLKKFKDWESKNPNPVKEIAEEGLNYFLKEFQLQVNTDVDFDKIEDLRFIKIKQTDGTDVPFPFLSTGTKQIILTSLPFYVLKPENAIILFDEPERSLYPDIQIKLIKELTLKFPNCQFFIATHSPVVAAAFEPWEVVELKFDPKDGKVFQEHYRDTTKENHVKHYRKNPQYLNYGDIYTEIFDLVEDGNEDVRKPELNKLATLMNEFDSLPNTAQGKQKKIAKMKIMKDLASKLNVDLKDYASNQ